MIMREADAQRLLALYLRDHHAAGTAGSLTVDRLARNVTLGQDARKELAEIAAEIKTDLGTLEDIMTTANIAQSAVKDALARTGAALGSLMPNGRVRTRSPLSDVIELETMLRPESQPRQRYGRPSKRFAFAPLSTSTSSALAPTSNRRHYPAGETRRLRTRCLRRETNEPASQPPAR